MQTNNLLDIKEQHLRTIQNYKQQIDLVKQEKICKRPELFYKIIFGVVNGLLSAILFSASFGVVDNFIAYLLITAGASAALITSAVLVLKTFNIASRIKHERKILVSDLVNKVNNLNHEINKIDEVLYEKETSIQKSTVVENLKYNNCFLDTQNKEWS